MAHPFAHNAHRVEHAGEEGNPGGPGGAPGGRGTGLKTRHYTRGGLADSPARVRFIVAVMARRGNSCGGVVVYSVGMRMVRWRAWRRRAKNLLAEWMSWAIWSFRSEGVENFFSGRRRFQKRTSMVRGVKLPE